MSDRKYLINYHTSGTSAPSSSGDVSLGELIIAHDNDNPAIYTLKNNGEFAKFVDEEQVKLKQNKLIAGSGITISGDVISTTSLPSEGMVEITYSELKDLADNSKLAPGTWYRITDYVTTVKELSTYAVKSAGHAFDLIVFADSETKINCRAHAAAHSGDTYFANCDLSRWEIWYDIDNSTNKYEWGDTTNGKGVIYRMIDEYGNDCPYDFKNLQSYRTYNNQTGLWSNVITYHSTEKSILCYTFSNALTSASTETTDTSIIKTNGVYQNVMQAYFEQYGLSQPEYRSFNYNCFFGTNTYGNKIDISSIKNTFGDYCDYNHLEEACNENVFANYCRYDVLKTQAISNKLGISCAGIIIGHNCSNITIRDYSYCIHFDSFNSYITIAGAFEYVHFLTENKNILLTCKQTTDRNNKCKNIIINGIKGDSTSSLKAITFNDVNQTYTTTIVGENDITMTV